MKSVTQTSRAAVSLRRSLMRLGLWARRRGVGRKLAVALAVAALLSGAATYAVMTGWAPTDPNSNAVMVLLNLDLVLLLILGAVVARQIAALWLRRRSGGAGSRLHLRFVALFSAVAVTPAILVAVFSALFFDAGVQAWFGERVRTALAESQAVAQAYLKEHQQVIAGEVLAVAADLQRNWPQLAGNTKGLEQFLITQTNVRGLTEAVVFDDTGKVRGRAGYTFSLQFEEVPFWALEKANRDEVAVLTGESDDRVRALVRMNVIPTLYLYIGRFVDQQVIQHMERTQEAVAAYQRLMAGRSDLEITFSLIFMVVALLLLFAAVWVGLTLATQLAQPIGELIDASERVRSGDLTVRVPELAAADEIAVLSRAFNRMTSRIATQQARLLSANRELDERRRFTETVLAGVSAGVVSTDPSGRLTLANRSASDLLHVGLEGHYGDPLGQVVPEFAELLAEEPRRSAVIHRELELRRDGRLLTFMVRAAAERVDGELVGHVFTFDDITELQSAQRKAAWADVARRVAHEIKNPLTPIQLSAERLKRRYLKQITDDREIFVQCTDTIVRHVVHIGQMVDEFSSFARMPSPVMKDEKLGALLSQAVFLQRTAYPAIRFEVSLPEAPVTWPCDSHQIGQALTNLLKNAVEAIEAVDHRPGGGVVRAVLRRDDDGSVCVTIEDNGRGLPADRARLTEPYVTTRAKGTGLGLAIVKKILEDHGADLILEDAPSGGARISMVFHAAARPLTDGSSSATDASSHGA
jgi:two-component system nitrogen regulation sensor histidine kinase NtrY